MKVYITKYALTQGIYSMEVDKIPENGVIRDPENALTYYHGEGKEWHRTKEAAVKRANEIREKKIESLKKSITKLERLNFEGMVQ